MYIEYLPGEKHPGKHPERSEFIESFEDCGMLIPSDEVVIDIDHLDKGAIAAMITTFNIKTEVVWTERGAHLWFKRPAWFKRRRDGVCKLAFEIEQHTDKSKPNGMTIKRNGVERKRDNQGARQYLPTIFEVPTGKKKCTDLTGMEEKEGRNKSLFAHRKNLNNCTGWEHMLRFINEHVFAEPMDEAEFNGIVRDMPMDSDVDDKYFIATEIIRDCRTKVYSGTVWLNREGRYVPDENKALIQFIYERCEGQPTRYVEEIYKQIQWRSEHVQNEKGFPIQFRNGAMIDGKFIPVRDPGFTPYYIDIEYDPEAEPVQIVDDYIDALTSNDKDYRDLLMEVMGFVMITDPEKIRTLGKFFMFRGDGANGKGTLLQILKKIYNPENCTSLSIKQLVDDRYKVTMIGKLANLGDDIEAEAINNDQLKVLKNISTADTVATRHLYSESESATFTTKLYFTTNSDIKSFEKGYAYKRRILWLPMFNKVEKIDPKFISKMTTPEALSYWIRLITEGYMRLYEHGWTKCKAVEDYNDQYHEKNNLCMQFARELNLETEIVGKTISELREHFRKWCSEEATFSPKLFKEAVWELYRTGIGKVKIEGESCRAFIKQANTSQDVKP